MEVEGRQDKQVVEAADTLAVDKPMLELEVAVVADIPAGHLPHSLYKEVGPQRWVDIQEYCPDWD